MISTTDLAQHTLEQVWLFLIAQLPPFFFYLILSLDLIHYLIVFVLIVVRYIALSGLKWATDCKVIETFTEMYKVLIANVVCSHWECWEIWLAKITCSTFCITYLKCLPADSNLQAFTIRRKNSLVSESVFKTKQVLKTMKDHLETSGIGIVVNVEIELYKITYLQVGTGMVFWLTLKDRACGT